MIHKDSIRKLCKFKEHMIHESSCIIRFYLYIRKDDNVIESRGKYEARGDHF